MPEHLETIPEAELETIREKIISTAGGAFSLLLQRRESAWIVAIEGLESEKESLAKESAAISEAAGNLSELLPAMARTAQAEHDRLLIAGDREGAAAKLAEQKEAEAGPERMRARQAAIVQRLDAIETQEKGIAKTIFEKWYSELQTVIRAAETALFISLLNAGRDSMLAFEAQHGLTGSLDRPGDSLIRDNHISGLTAGENTVLWAAGQRWYQGRVRR
jgi:chorismate mutase